MKSLPLEDSPYSLDPTAAQAAVERIEALDARVGDLRSSEKLTATTLERYYGRTRMEQIAESNAIEGSTLSAGETELAVLRGVTLTGHDPAYVRDALALSSALEAVNQLATSRDRPTDIAQLRQVHGVILGDRDGAGIFRTVQVRISGSAHTPPKTWREVMDAMEAWQAWSLQNADAPAVLRAAVLHAWLAHIHPFIDGNGRTARAVTTLELVRGGLPSAIIRKRERARYLDALQRSDVAGDLGAFLELILDRSEQALRGLELAASKEQGYDPLLVQLERRQRAELQVWNTAVQLLATSLELRLDVLREHGRAEVAIERFGEGIDLEDYCDLCASRTISKSWAFHVSCRIPGVPPSERLAWVGFRSFAMQHGAGLPQGPSLFWSTRNPDRYPPWLALRGHEAPGFEELTLVPVGGDRWFARTGDEVRELALREVVDAVAAALVAG